MPPEANGTAHAPANYLEGNPSHPDSILGGRLDCDPGGGLRFSSSRGELLLGLDSLLGISISGRTPARDDGNEIRGTMRVASLSRGEPAEWVFAVDRSAAASLQRQLNHELAARGRPALPHVEELVGFPSNGAARLPEEVADPAPIDRVAAELGHRLDGADRKPSSRRRVVFWIAIAAVAVMLEILVPLILLRGG
jgi:hypothetical protein